MGYPAKLLVGFFNFNVMKKRGRKRVLADCDPWASLPIYTVEDNDRVFKQHVGGYYKYPLDNFTPWIKHGKLRRLPKEAQEECWAKVQTLITYRSTRHFGRVQSKTYQLDRILSFYEWSKIHWFRTPQWIRYSWECNFPGIEAVLQCRRWGIGLPHDNCLLNAKTKFIKYFIIYFVLKRDKISIEEHYISTAKKAVEMYPDVELEYVYYLNLVERALYATSSTSRFLGSEQLHNQTYGEAISSDDELW